MVADAPLDTRESGGARTLERGFGAGVSGGRSALRYGGRMRLSGRFVRVFHWIAPVLLPLLVLWGRALFGAPLGWLAAFGILAVPFVTIAMYIAPIIVVFDRDAKVARSTRLSYNIASWVTWAALLVMMFTIVDGGDSPPFGSVLSTWGWMSSNASSDIFAGAVLVAFLGWLGTVTTAIIGVVLSRTPGRSPAETSLPA
ncbi:hypothetical protein GCM10007269_05040 [Microbacterium murale]|uniref:Uncharacterized protein n=2 Tax=Microbacterium murale TaxID=1081040 RepID=A0ABQ1RC66_9MICO|nr:hypothetical protein GCM10007269_05040 [Microbacterium murale]